MPAVRAIMTRARPPICTATFGRLPADGNQLKQPALADEQHRHHPGLRLQRRLGRGPPDGPHQAQYRSPLGRRPYDLRHAAVSLWLNSGVPATEVARRAGHGVAVLLKIYAHCIDGQADAANQRITDALGVEADEGEGEDGGQAS
jgi:integrase